MTDDACSENVLSCHLSLLSYFIFFSFVVLVLIRILYYISILLNHFLRLFLSFLIQINKNTRMRIGGSTLLWNIQKQNNALNDFFDRLSNIN